MSLLPVARGPRVLLLAFSNTRPMAPLLHTIRVAVGLTDRHFLGPSCIKFPNTVE